jgi:2-oxoglutarate dehydrogenase E1 component
MVSSINSWLEDELYQRYLHDRGLVDQSWQDVFSGNGGHTESAEAAAAEEVSTVEDIQRTRREPQPDAAEALPAENAPAVQDVPREPQLEPDNASRQIVTKTPPQSVALAPGEELVPLRGAAARIAENMTASLAVPVATSQRVIPVKVVDENRRIINQHRALTGKGKISYTHVIGWAIVRALDAVPAINHAYGETEDGSFRVVRTRVNLGIAIDLEGKDGARSLVVPSIKDAGAMNFRDYIAAFDDLVRRARNGKLTVDDFRGTTISLTNPGTVGTVGSMPRLMLGQGAIIATGAIDYPAEYRGVADETRAALGLSKVMTVTCTYDHRIIQGAESGMFLGKLEDLLQGQDGFYEQLFSDLGMPHRPVRWEPDRLPSLAGGRTQSGLAETAKEAAVLQLINAYRVRGHLIADLDPLGSEPSYHPELDPATYGLTIWDLDREFLTGTLGEAIGEGAPQPVATLREILETLRHAYCGKVGCEYMNIQVPEQKRWIQQSVEPTAATWELEADDRIRTLERLIQAEEFEHFLHARYVGHKRFSLEGAEAAIAIMDELLDRAADTGVHEVVIGMAHRGRLNVLANVVGKNLNQIFSEFEGNIDPASTQGSGDVKYHLGAKGTHQSPAGNEIVVSVSPNPSHLEAVDPVVEGIVRPKQDRLGDTKRERVIPLLIHGDAAFAGQGVVAETLNLSQLDGYHTGGTVHLVINNQIGFTTGPEESRSSPYPTDVARTVQAPIFHINGDDPEAAIRVAQIAFDYRQRFKKDVVIDMICYRRHGHNEADDPSYTQPILYRKIKNQPSVAALYGARLVRDRVIGEDNLKAIRKRIAEHYAHAFDEVKRAQERYEYDELTEVQPEEFGPIAPRTAIERAQIERILNGLTIFPAGFNIHPKLRNWLERRKEVLNGTPLDWATAEALAFGSLVLEGTPVRLSGQDSGRGTFSQRHLEFYDYESGDLYVPMQHLSQDQARFEVWDSSLSEYAVMGFEFGYSIGDPLTLVIWEAQFGDFVNGAQIIVDQFLTSAEYKWGQPSGLVLLLPHGYEGQGPEHSSGRIERFLILSAENNIQVTNCTTPAQYFHLLRRQMYGGQDRRGVRKPLIIFTPKSLLRHPKAVSSIQDLTTGTFRPALADSDQAAPDRVTRILLCSGKVYYDLLAAREEKKVQHVAIIRLEQLYPFPADEVRDMLMRYPLSAELLWVQEEPRNMGPWRFIREYMQPMLENPQRTLRYVGRRESASTAAGSLKRHQQEQADLLEEAFAAEAIVRPRRVRRVK